MATYTAAISPNYTLTLTCTETNVNNQNNTSTIQYSYSIKSNGQRYAWGSNPYGYSATLTINGVTVINRSQVAYNFSSANYQYTSITATNPVVIGSGTTSAISHNADGSKSIAIKATFNSNRSDGALGNGSISQTMTLTTIPRASTLSNDSSITIGSTSGNLGVKVVSKADYYHKVDYQFSGGSWVNLVDKLRVNNTTSAAQNLSYSTILAAMPNTANSTVTFRVLTYSDSNETAQVGSTQTSSCAVTINTANIKPSITLGNITAVQPSGVSISGALIAGYSQARTAYTVTNSAGAGSVTTKFSISTGTMATTSVTNTSGNATSNTLPSNTNNITNLKITATATDSRGASVTISTSAATIYGYSAPKITGNFYRVATASSTSADAAGLFVYGTYSGAVGASVNNLNSIVSTTCSMSGSLYGDFTSGDHKALAADQQVKFTVTTTDKVSSKTNVYSVPVAKFSLDLYDNGSGTVGASVGGVSEANFFDVYLRQRSKNVGNGQWINSVRTPAILIDNKVGTSNAMTGMTLHTKDGMVGISSLESANSLILAYMLNSRSTNGLDGRFIFDFDTMTISGTPTVNFVGESKTARQLTRTLGNDSARMDTADNIYTDGSLRVYQATSTMTVNKPARDGHILHFAWDNTGGWNTQLFVSNSGSLPRMQIRSQTNTNWNDWHDISVERTLWTGTLRGSNTVSIDFSGCRRARIYCILYYTQICYEIDLETRPSSHPGSESDYPYEGSGYGAEHSSSNTLEFLYSMSAISTNKKTFKHSHTGIYKLIDGSHGIRDNNNYYYVYRIDGIY